MYTEYVQYLDDCFIVDEAEVTTTVHRVGAGGGVVANAALAWIQFFIDYSQFERGRVMPDGHTKQNGLNDRQEKNEDEHTVENNRKTK